MAKCSLGLGPIIVVEGKGEGEYLIMIRFILNMNFQNNFRIS